MVNGITTFRERTRDSEESTQISKQKKLESRFEDIRNNLDDLKMKLKDVFNIDVNAGQMVQHSDQGQSYNQAAMQVVGSELLQTLTGNDIIKSSWGKKLSYVQHEIDQTVRITEILSQTDKILSNLNYIVQFIKNNQFSLHVNLVDIVEEKYQEDGMFSRYYNTYSSSGDWQQRKQNNSLEDIKAKLDQASIMLSNIGKTFGRALYRKIEAGSLLESMKLLEVADLNTMINGKNILEHSLENGSDEIKEAVIATCNKQVLETKFSNGELPIAYAVNTANEDLLMRSLSTGVDPNTVIKPVQYSDGIMNLLLSNFYSIGTTPLHLAIEKYSITYGQEQAMRFNTVKTLVDFDSTRVNIPDNKCETAYQVIESLPILQRQLGDNLPNRLEGKDKVNYVDKAEHNIYFQYGVIVGKSLVAPAIDCLDKKVTGNDYGQGFYRCYEKSFNSYDIVSALKYPAFSLALQSYVDPAYTMLALTGCDLYQEGPITLASILKISSGFAINAVASYHIGQQPIYQDHPFVIATMVTTAVPAAQLVKDIVVESYDSLYCSLIGCNSEQNANTEL